jgi:hypothetical protein
MGSSFYRRYGFQATLLRLRPRSGAGTHVKLRIWAVSCMGRTTSIFSAEKALFCVLVAIAERRTPQIYPDNGLYFNRLSPASISCCCLNLLRRALPVVETAQEFYRLAEHAIRHKVGCTPDNQPRVPARRPARPLCGNCGRLATADTMMPTWRAAAPGSSRAM